MLHLFVVLVSLFNAQALIAPVRYSTSMSAKIDHDSSRVTVAYRSLSRLLPSDPMARILAGDAKIQEVCRVLGSVHATHGQSVKNNMKEAFAVKHHWITLQLEKMLRNNPDLNQVVILGAGMDTRTYTVDSLNNCKVFEVDHKEVMNLKSTLIDKYGFNIPLKAKSVTRVGCTFGSEHSSDWLQTMCFHGFDRHKPAVFILENLLYYLPRELASSMMSVPLQCSSPGSGFIFDIVNHQSSPLPRDCVLRSDLTSTMESLGYKHIHITEAGASDAHFGVLDTEVLPPSTDYGDSNKLIHCFLVSALT